MSEITQEKDLTRNTYSGMCREKSFIQDEGDSLTLLFTYCSAWSFCFDCGFFFIIIILYFMSEFHPESKCSLKMTVLKVGSLCRVMLLVDESSCIHPSSTPHQFCYLAHITQTLKGLISNEEKKTGNNRNNLIGVSRIRATWLRFNKCLHCYNTIIICVVSFSL